MKGIGSMIFFSAFLSDSDPRIGDELRQQRVRDAGDATAQPVSGYTWNSYYIESLQRYPPLVEGDELQHSSEADG
jgi:hypothetical protein